MTALRLSLVASTALFSIIGVSGAGAQIVPDGGTATSMTTGASGRPTISIAPVSPGGVSHNTYSQFSVAPVGANLDNTTTRATIIVNQVTSTSRSYLYGPVEVLGSRAHVVLANPNGITVDGGTFVNTGGVVLSGGTVRYDSSGNPIVPTGSGDIAVGRYGLGGTMSTLQLLAARIKVDGPIVNEHVSPNAEISLLAGNSELTLDTNVPASSTLRPLVKARRNLDSSTSEVLVDVTPNGYMSASRVKIAVSAKGAGVNFDGFGKSTVGTFTIDASGKISSRGGTILGESGVKLSGASVAILNAPDRASYLSSNSGPVTVLANSGNIDVLGQIIGARQGDDPDARGAVTLQATGDINIFTESADRLALAYGASGDVVIDAGGNITNNSGRILSNGTVYVHAGATLNNLTQTVGAVASGTPQVTTTRKRFWLSWLFGKKKRIITTFDYGQLRLPGERALIFAANVVINADKVVNSGEISAADGSLAITARAVENNAIWTGSGSFEKNCRITCWARGSSTVNATGGVMNAQYGLSIDATESLSNNGGFIIAYGNLAINAASVTNSAAFVPTIVNRPSGLGNFWAGPTAWLGYQPIGGYIYAPIGSVTITSGAPVVIDGGVIEGKTGTDIPNGTTEIRNAKPIGPPHGKPIGQFRDFIP